MKRTILFIFTLIAATVLVAGDCQHGKAAEQVKKDDCCAWMKDAKFEVVNTETGVKVVVTAPNAEAVKAVQEHFAMVAKEGCAHKTEMAGCRHGEKKDCCKDKKAEGGCKHDGHKDCCKGAKDGSGCKHGQEKKAEPVKCLHAEEKTEQPKS